MNIAKKNWQPAIIAALLALVAIGGYWAIAKGKAPSVAAAHPCQSGTPGCAAPTASSPHIAVADATHRIICAPGDQTCDTRTQDARTNAYRDLRDRHSERD